MRRRSSGSVCFSNGGGCHCRVSRWQAAGHGSHLCGRVGTGKHQTPFQPVSGRHRHHTDCSTRVVPLPRFKTEVVTPATDRDRADYGSSAPESPAPEKTRPVAERMADGDGSRSFSWCCSPSVQYRRFYVTGTEFIHHNQPRKGQRRRGLQGPDSIKSSSRAQAI